MAKLFLSIILCNYLLSIPTCNQNPNPIPTPTPKALTAKISTTTPTIHQSEVGIRLDGSNSKGNFVRCYWRELSDDLDVEIVDMDSLKTIAWFTKKGVYYFELDLFDKDDIITSDTVAIEVK